MLHPPQLLRSVAWSTQRTGVPHMIWVVDVPQGWHIPAPQLAVLAQMTPHPPQLLGSLFMSTQLVVVPVPHILCVVGHTQALFTQLAPCEHVIPQPPQLFGSLVVYTQVALAPAPQKRSVPGQMHMPPWHGAPAGHRVPQLPQLLRSFIVSTQTPLHTVVGQAFAPSPSVAASVAPSAPSTWPSGVSPVVASASVEFSPVWKS